MRFASPALVVLLAACVSTPAAPDAGVDASMDAPADAVAPDVGVDLGMPADSDGDGIADDVELGPDPAHPVDTDGDGTPDYLDLDSDGDTILDRDEWNAAQPDLDMDGVANYLDLDSDGDGVSDAVEAGDTVLATFPVSCPNEVDPTTLTRTLVGGTVPYPGDGLPDWLDFDSDNDIVSDGDELRLGTNPCTYDAMASRSQHVRPTSSLRHRSVAGSRDPSPAHRSASLYRSRVGRRRPP